MTPRTAVVSAVLLAALASPTAASAAEITFGADLEYSPNPTSVAPGEPITWRGDFAAHPIASATGAFPDQSRGGTYTVALAKPGTYTYFCQLHSDGKTGMVAKLVVRDAPAVGPVAPRPKVTAPRRIGPTTRTVRVTAVRAGTASLTVTDSGETLASGRTRFDKRGTRSVLLTLNAAARERVRRAGSVTAQLRTRVVTRSGAVTTFTQPVVLVR